MVGLIGLLLFLSFYIFRQRYQSYALEGLKRGYSQISDTSSFAMGTAWLSGLMVICFLWYKSKRGSFHSEGQPFGKRTKTIKYRD